MHAWIRTPTPNLEASRDYYSRLQFENVTAPTENSFSDGKIVIEIDPTPTARTAICFEKEWFGEIPSELQDYVNPMTIEDELWFTDPSGVPIIISGKTVAQSRNEPCSFLGNTAGVSIETGDMQQSVRFWNGMGFTITQGAADAGWATLERDGSFGISLMPYGTCPHLFFSPGITYFNSGRNMENIEKIRAAGVQIAQEIGAFHPEGKIDNVVMVDPGGTGSFVFND